MSLTQTALAADLAIDALTMSVASGTGFPAVGTIANPGYLVRIDNEYLLAVAQPVAGTIKIAMRGYNGTVAAAHDVLAKVQVSALAADFTPNPPGASVSLPPYTPIQQTIGEDIAYAAADVLAWGNQPQNFAILKATAAAITLAAPSKAQDGETIVFTSDTAAAHVITATSLIADGVSGSPHTTATFAAFIGATITLQAQNGLWNMVSTKGVTIT